MHRTASFLVGLVVVVVAACGGSSGSDINGAVADAGGASSSGASSGTSSSGASSSGASSSGASSSGASSSGSTTTDGGTDGGSAVGNTTTQTCGGAACAIADSVCCVTPDGAKCMPKAQGCGGGGGGGDTASLACGGQANCVSGTVCCVRQTSSGTASECKAKCADNEAQLCDPSATVSGCAADVKCSNHDIHDWNLPATFATCGGVGN